MKSIALIALITLSFSAPSFAQSFDETPKEWFSCLSDSDCAMTYNECGNFIGVNTASLPKAEAFFKELGPKVNCVSPSGPFEKSDFSVTCQHTKEPCIIKKWFGLAEEIDPASTCASQTKKCVAQIRPSTQQ